MPIVGVFVNQRTFKAQKDITIDEIATILDELNLTITKSSEQEMDAFLDSLGSAARHFQPREGGADE